MTPFPAPNRLHVWWARRPLVASRAAVLASLLPADADRERSSFSHRSMSSVNPLSFGRRTRTVRRYPGGTENCSIFLTLSRETPKCFAAARSLIPS